MFAYYLPWTLSTLGKNSADDILNSFFVFLGKQDLTFYGNCLHWRHFPWNVKSCFLGKIRKLSINLLSAEFAQGLVKASHVFKKGYLWYVKRSACASVQPVQGLLDYWFLETEHYISNRKYLIRLWRLQGCSVNLLFTHAPRPNFIYCTDLHELWYTQTDEIQRGENVPSDICPMIDLGQSAYPCSLISVHWALFGKSRIHVQGIYSWKLKSAWMHCLVRVFLGCACRKVHVLFLVYIIRQCVNIVVLKYTSCFVQGKMNKGCSWLSY